MQEEYISFSKSGISVGVEILSGKDAETGVFLKVIPSLKLSAYGNTEKEAKEMLFDSLTDYMVALHGLPAKKRNVELINTGWKKAPHKNKEYKPYLAFENPTNDCEFKGEISKQIETHSIAA